MRRLAYALALGLVALPLIAYAATYTATFDGTPPAPQPFASLDFDVQVHNRDAANSGMANVNAEHGADCSAPPATHVQAGGVFICNNHVMTTLNEEGYGAIYLTPDQMVDFSSGGTVSFELSTEKLSVRDWWDLTVSPFLDAQALPLLSDLSQGVDLQGPNRNSIVLATDNNQGAPHLSIVRNGAVTSYAPNLSLPFNSGVTATNQAATRQSFRLTLTTTSVKFERLASTTASAMVFVNQTIPALSWTQGVIQFGHHSYNPTKDGAGQPATWHWDTFAIDPAIPFYIGHFSTRSTTGGTITADAPAPSGSYLRFSAVCKPKVNGVTPTKMVDSGHPEHFSSYLMPIAAGTQNFNVTFSADSWYGTGFGCMAKDYSIVSLTGGAPSPSPTPQTPTPSPTPSASPSPSPSPTASPTPSPTVSPTPSPTPTPLTYSCVRSDGTVIWSDDSGGRTCP